MRAVILAAGRGQRLKASGWEDPKPADWEEVKRLARFSDRLVSPRSKTTRFHVSFLSTIES